MDRRAFGAVTFPREKGKARINIKPLQKALENTLGVRIKGKRTWLFGKKYYAFEMRGETVKVHLTENGDARLDLAQADDEVRETILETIRQSFDFEGR
jgi:hypothetical protein